MSEAVAALVAEMRYLAAHLAWATAEHRRLRIEGYPLDERFKFCDAVMMPAWGRLLQVDAVFVSRIKQDAPGHR